MESPLVIHVKPRHLYRSPDIKTVCLGSCFAEHFAVALDKYGLDQFHRRYTCNHFNPQSLADMLTRMTYDSYIEAEDVYPTKYGATSAVICTTPYLRGLFAETKADLLQRARAEYDAFRKAVFEADVFLLTLGTADILVMKDSNRVQCCANYIDSDQYTFATLSTEEIYLSLEQILACISKLRAGRMFQVILSVSPQRYFWDTSLTGLEIPQDLVGNQLSKNKLRVAIDLLICRHQGVTYFPGYEIVIDELRGYESLYDNGAFVHVNPRTADLVLDRFFGAYFGDSMQDYLRLYKRVLRVQEHARRVPHLRRTLDEMHKEIKAMIESFALDGKTPGRLLHALYRLEQYLYHDQNAVLLSEAQT